MSRGHSDALATITLANEAMELVVAPALGGKILSLRSQATGREWLWKNPYLPLRTPPPGSVNFGDYDAGGWDEIFPSVDPCDATDSPWGLSGIGDHGVLWSRCWKKLESAAPRSRGNAITLVVDEPELPFRFKRTLTVAPGRGPLLVDYALENHSDAPLPYIWAAHPLIAVAPGMTIGLPRGVRTTAATTMGFELANRATQFEWPLAEAADGQMIDFSRVPGRGAGIAAKLFTDRLTQGLLQLISERGDEALRISFDANDVPYMGLWLNYGAWSGANTTPYFNCGVEPTTSPCDRLNMAIRRNQASPLPAGATRRWKLAVALASIDD